MFIDRNDFVKIEETKYEQFQGNRDDFAVKGKRP